MVVALPSPCCFDLLALDEVQALELPAHSVPLPAPGALSEALSGGRLAQRTYLTIISPTMVTVPLSNEEGQLLLERLLLGGRSRD